MKLHWNPASPYARKCLVTAKELSLEDQIDLVERGGSPLASDNMPVTQNPLGKLPVLERREGPAIYDSRVITRYLNDLAGGTLYPDARLWDTLTLEATADGILDAAVLMVYEVRCRPDDIRSPDWVEAQWAKITRALDVIEDRWMSHLHGPFDAAQIGVAAALGYLDFRHPGREWRAGRASLVAWEQKMLDRDSIAETKPRDPL